MPAGGQAVVHELEVLARVEVLDPCDARGRRLPRDQVELSDRWSAGNTGRPRCGRASRGRAAADPLRRGSTIGAIDRMSRDRSTRSIDSMLAVSVSAFAVLPTP